MLGKQHDGIPEQNCKEKTLQYLWKLWRSSDTFIFRSATDAVWGMIVLILIPLVSLYFVYKGGGVIFSNYGFPFLSVVCAALYDTYGRIVSIKAPDGVCHNVAKAKLTIRASLDIISLLIAFLACGVSTSKFLWISPGVLLMIPGILLVNEVVQRIRKSFLLAFGRM